MKIAWIGIGVMGESMAGHLLDAGHELFVYNRTVSKTDGLVKRGATLLKEVKDAPLNADVIFSMVGYPKDVEEVYFSPSGRLPRFSNHGARECGLQVKSKFGFR